MRNASPGGAIPPSRSHQGPRHRRTSARESGSKSAPEGTPGIRGRPRVLGWALGTGQSPPSRWAGQLPAAATGIPVLARTVRCSPRVQARFPPAPWPTWNRPPRNSPIPGAAGTRLDDALERASYVASCDWPIALSLSRLSAARPILKE